MPIQLVQPAPELGATDFLLRTVTFGLVRVLRDRLWSFHQNLEALIWRGCRPVLCDRLYSFTLGTNVDLNRAWQFARHERAESAARSEWQEAPDDCRHLGRGAPRQLAPAAHAWLYRNDRGWRTASIEVTLKIERGNYSNVPLHGDRWRVHRMPRTPPLGVAVGCSSSGSASDGSQSASRTARSMASNAPGGTA